MKRLLKIYRGGEKRIAHKRKGGGSYGKRYGRFN